MKSIIQIRKKFTLWNLWSSVMMLQAVVLLNCDYRSIKDTIKAIGKITGIMQSHATSGAYDAILKVETHTENELRNVIRDVAAVSGVITIVNSIIMGVK